MQEMWKRCRFEPWVGKIPWRRYGSPPQYSCLENPMDRGPSLATVHGVAESDTTEVTQHTHTASHDAFLNNSLYVVLSETQKNYKEGKTLSRV